MQLTIGSHRLCNTDGVISVRGNRQIRLEWGPLNSELLLTMDLYGAGGNHIARLRRNHWTFNDNNRFDFTANMKGLNIVDTKLSQVVLDARILGADSVVITQGEFFTSSGRQIELTKVDWNAATEPQTAKQPASKPENARFSEDETSRIRKAVESPNDTPQCPRCGCPLTWVRTGGGTNGDAMTVSCIMCRLHVDIDKDS